MSAQRGFKRAQKVMKRKQRLARVGRKTNIKQAIYQLEKSIKEAHGEESGHGHEGHSHD